uniref:Uncharacterized protein n=1 Tax=Anguilla anguilla TaxID=7936 RepID=A0A0E9RW30_ANGAN
MIFVHACFCTVASKTHQLENTNILFQGKQIIWPNALSTAIQHNSEIYCTNGDLI